MDEFGILRDSLVEVKEGVKDINKKLDEQFVRKDVFEERLLRIEGASWSKSTTAALIGLAGVLGGTMFDLIKTILHDVLTKGQ